MWASGNTPTGSIHDMGVFKKNMGAEATDLNEIDEIMGKPKNYTGHSKRSSLVLNL